MKSIAKIILFVSVLSLSFQIAYALNTKSHMDINEYASKNTLNNFSLDTHLKKYLGIEKGIDEQFRPNNYFQNWQKVWQWISMGGEYEDVPYFFTPYVRSVNHFHNPLNDQGYNGFWGTGIMAGMSSTQWALLPAGTQSTFCLWGCYSWNDVRGYYYQALVSTDIDARINNFAQTFRGVGQLMHLVEDASVPSHTKNDGHVFYNYEKYVEIYINRNGVPTPDSAGFFSGTINNIASFIDTGQYSNPSPDPDIAVGTNIGLSEYTNANFFSEDTINNLNYPYPQISEQTPVTERDITNTLWNTTYPRQYYLKNCCGETNEGQGYLLAAVDYLDYYRNQYPALSFALHKITVLDDNVYGDYASLLLPRAVGYSAGLLNYFFRGSIAISIPDTGIYAQTDDPPQGFKSIRLLAENITSTGEEMTDGSIELVVKYKLALEDPFQSIPVSTDTEFTYITVPEANNIHSIPRGNTTELTFGTGQSTIIPLRATHVYLQVVFKGRLGNEDGAVAVGFKDISEPTPIDLFNNMDKTCLYGNWYAAGSPEAIAQVDTDQNGTPEWDIYIHDIQDAYLKISKITSPVSASPSDYTFYGPLVTAGTLYRAYVLSDYDYSFNLSDYMTALATAPEDTWAHASGGIISGDKAASAIKNQTDYNVESQTECDTVGATAPCEIRYYPAFYPFRGINIWGPAGYIIDNPKYPIDTECSWDLLQ